MFIVINKYRQCDQWFYSWFPFIILSTFLLVPSLHCKCLGSKSLQPPNKRNGSNMINSNIWDSPRLMMPLDGARNCRVAATQAGMRLYEPSLHSGRGRGGAGRGEASRCQTLTWGGRCPVAGRMQAHCSSTHIICSDSRLQSPLSFLVPLIGFFQVAFYKL